MHKDSIEKMEVDVFLRNTGKTRLRQFDPSIRGSYLPPASSGE